MRKALLALTVLLLASLACSIDINGAGITRGSGTVITEERAVADFTRIDSGTSIDVTVTKGDSYSLKIEGEDNILPLVTTEVSGGALIISTKPNTSYSTTKRMHITITAKELVEMRVSASGDVEVSGFSGENFKAVVSASGRLRINDLQVNALEARISASGDIVVDGSAERLQVRVSASGNFEGEDFKAQRVDAETSASGNITVWAVEAIDASTTASGNVTYSGDPSSVKENESASGRIYHKGSK